MSGTEANIVIEIRNLTIAFGSTDDSSVVVEDLNLQLEKGKTLGIVGESGSGKTLTSLAIMQLLPPGGRIERGEIIFREEDGKQGDLLKLDSKGIRKQRGKNIAMIFQEPMSSLNPVMRCGRQVMESLQLHLKLSRKEAGKRCLELFREVKLPRPESIFRSYPHQLSGGQKQRVMIAMAMSCKPGLLIADEPTTALDVSVQKSILLLMKELGRKYGTSIIFITHDLGIIRQIADDVMVMRKGKVVENGRVDQIFNHPKHPYTQGLMACRPAMNTRPKKLLTVNDFLETARSNEKPSIQLVGEEERSKRHKEMYRREPFLKVEDLSTWFVDGRNWLGKPKSFVKAVDDVSFSLFPGETLGLVGESGSGKTSLGRTILNLQRKTSGKIEFSGKDISKLSGDSLRNLRREMQIIFQDPYSSLNPRITAGEAIMEPMKVHHLNGSKEQRKARTYELMERVGLEQEHFNRYPHEFSGGQRQRIGIARALALEPRFIVCDESVSALDVSVQAQVLNLLNELKDEFGLTYIFISHDLSVVRYMSDRILVLKDGKIVEEGEADKLVQHPVQDYTQRLIESIPGFSNPEIHKPA